MTKSECPKCHKSIALTKAGTFRVHGTSARWDKAGNQIAEMAVCPGTGEAA